MNEQIVSSGMAQLRDPQEVLKPAGAFSTEQTNFSDDSQRDEETQALSKRVRLEFARLSRRKSGGRNRKNSSSSFLQTRKPQQML